MVCYDKDIVVGVYVVLKCYCIVEKYDEVCCLKIEMFLCVCFNIEKSVL